MNLIYKIAADLILFGWFFHSLWYVYMITLAGALISELVWSYCFLSKWEFNLRKKVNPNINYDYSYTSYYTHKITRQHLSPRFLARLGILFTSLSLVINLYFKFLF